MFFFPQLVFEEITEHGCLDIQEEMKPECSIRDHYCDIVETFQADADNGGRVTIPAHLAYTNEPTEVYLSPEQVSWTRE